MQIGLLGTSTDITIGNLNQSLRAFAIVSDGTAPITLRMTSGGAGVVDIYASARLIAVLS